MTKYIRLIKNIDNSDKKIILRFNNCNDCPLMVHDKNKSNVSCRKYINGTSRIIKEYVDNVDIDIPTWCGLSNDIFELDEHKETYLVKDGKVFTSLNSVNEKNIPICDSSFFNKKTKIDINNLRESININDDDEINDIGWAERMAETHRNERFEIPKNNTTKKVKEIEEEDNDTTNYTDYKNILVCSSCGDYSDSVDRNINNGMCEKCYNKHKDNKNKLYQCYVTNFRLKRGINFINTQFRIT